MDWKIPLILGLILIIGLNSYFYIAEKIVSVPSGNVTYFWDFGDGTNSTDFNVQHTFAGKGLYKVKLYITNGTQHTWKTFIIDAQEGTKFQSNLIPIQIEEIKSAG